MISLCSRKTWGSFFILSVWQSHTSPTFPEMYSPNRSGVPLKFMASSRYAHHLCSTGPHTSNQLIFHQVLYKWSDNLTQSLHSPTYKQPICVCKYLSLLITSSLPFGNTASSGTLLLLACSDNNHKKVPLPICNLSLSSPGGLNPKIWWCTWRWRYAGNSLRPALLALMFSSNSYFFSQCSPDPHDSALFFPIVFSSSISRSSTSVNVPPNDKGSFYSSIKFRTTHYFGILIYFISFSYISALIAAYLIGSLM